MISLTVMTSAVQRFGGLTKMSVCMKHEAEETVAL